MFCCLLFCFNFGLSCNSALWSLTATPILGVKGEGCTNPKRLVWPGQKAKLAERWEGGVASHILPDASKEGVSVKPTRGGHRTEGQF